MSTLSELRTRARRKVDAVGNEFFSDAEIGDYVNIGLGELHDLLVSKQEDYYVRKLSFTLATSKADYNFSDIGLHNFYKLLAVDSKQGSDTFRVKRFGLPDRNRFRADLAFHNSRGYSNYEYSIQEKTIKFIPDPVSTDTISLYYVPSFSPLNGDDAEVDDGIMSNWEEYAVIVAAIKMRQKEETSVATLERDLERTTARIEEASRDRDSAEPFGITDETTGILHGFWSS